MKRRYASIAAKCMFHCARETERKTRRFGSERETSDTDDDDEVVPNYQIADKLLFSGSKRGRDIWGLPFNDVVLVFS